MSLLERYIQPGESQLPTVSHTGEIPSGQPTCTITIDGQEVTAIPGEAIRRVPHVPGRHRGPGPPAALVPRRGRARHEDRVELRRAVQAAQAEPRVHPQRPQRV